MSTVTQRVREVKQPRGGYLKPSVFEKKVFYDGNTLLENENVHASIMGMVVDYMTRFLISGDVYDAFQISGLGYSVRQAILGGEMSDCDSNLIWVLNNCGIKNISAAKRKAIEIADGENSICELIKRIKGLDDDSLIAACKATTYDVWYRVGAAARLAKGAKDNNPNADTLQNLRILIQRTVSFFNEVGPIVSDGFCFAEYDENNKVCKTGYTKTVTNGDGDYLTKDTMWDVKVSKRELNKNYTLQILMYYIMGVHSEMDLFKNIENIGFYNPRQNTMYKLNVKEIPEETISVIERDVIGY